MADPNSKADAVDTTVRADDEQNPTNNPPTEGDGAAAATATAATATAAANRPRRTPFTNLSQVDADLALARTLQEQERAYMMLRMDMGEGSDYGSWEAESYEDEDEVDAYDDASEEDYDGSDVEVDDEAEDAFDVHARAAGVESDSQNDEVDPSAFSSDEAYARALQDAEEREMAARLLALAGINDMVVGEDDEEEDDDDDDDDGEYDEDEEEHGSNAQDAWEEVDPDELSYEELIALGDVIGTESRGLSADAIASLPSVNYNSKGTHEGNGDSCVICRLDYEDDDNLTVLSCKHLYHPECISNWLNINKVCPVCSAEVSIPGKS